MPLLLRLAPSDPDRESPRAGWTPVAESKRGEERSGGQRLSPSDFESALRPHLSAAFNLARWLTRSQADAEDVLQESTLRAFRSYDSVRPASLRAWLLRIVRNRCYDLRKEKEREPIESALDVDALSEAADSSVVALPAESPEARLLRLGDGDALRHALLALPAEFREVFLLREVEGLAYKEIAEVASVPIGTVMSRLSRARAQLRLLLAGQRRKETA